MSKDIRWIVCAGILAVAVVFVADRWCRMLEHGANVCAGRPQFVQLGAPVVVGPQPPNPPQLQTPTLARPADELPSVMKELE